MAFDSCSGCGGMEILDDMETKIPPLVLKLNELATSEPITPGEYDCICAPDVTGMIVHEAFGHGVEMDMFVKKRALAEKYMPDGSCGVISFGLKGGRRAAGEFMDKLKFVAIVTHVADARTCILHPASHTHRQLNEEQLIEAGVLPDLIRLSVGIEDVDDLIADLAQALEAV